MRASRRSLLLALLATPTVALVRPRPGAAQPPLEVFAGGLINPRGLTFGPDGSLYVAEAGNGGEQLVEVGTPRPHAIGRSGRLSRIGPDGQRTTVDEGLPSTVDAYDEEVGPSDLAFLDGQLYLLTASGGWDVGDPAFHSAIFRVGPGGALEKVFDYSAWCLEHPNRARLEDPRADAPMGMPYGLAALGHRLYTTDGNWEQILSIDPTTGQAERLAEYQRSNRALTGIKAGPDGALYVAEFAANKVTRITPDGQITDAATKLRIPIDVAFNRDAQLYILQFAYRETPPGEVLRAAPLGQPSREVLVSDLTRPTAMVFGPDGGLYISNAGSAIGKGSAAEGQILRLPPS